MSINITENNKEFINKYIEIEKQYEVTANELLDGKLKLLNGLDLLNISRGIDWNYQHQISANTYQLYLHTLNYVKSLVKSYLVSEKKEYIISAQSIVQNWIHYNMNIDEKINYAWYDHTVSNRLQNILYYQVNVPTEYRIDAKVFYEVYEKHIDYLSQYKNYPENNHGIMMDRALLMGSLFNKNKELINNSLILVKNRIEKAILRDFSYNNVHLENSPDYHRMVTNWLNSVSKMLDDVEFPLSKKYKNKLNQAINYNGIVVNYKNEYPMIGDTSYGVSKFKKSDEDFIDYEAGVAIFNDKRYKSTLVFNCGFQNLTHKHHDDLSFTLTMDNEQILVDSGKYNYSKKDPVRLHMTSPKAHTTLFVQDKTYPLDIESNIKITNAIYTDEYKIIKSIHEGYNDISIERIVISIKEGAYFIVDNIQALQQNTYVQNFVFDERIKLNKIGKRKYELTTSLNNRYILEEHSKVATEKIFKGKDSLAVISKKFNELQSTTRLEIRKKTKNTNYLTSISKKKMKLENIRIDNNILSFEIDNKIKNIDISN